MAIAEEGRCIKRSEVLSYCLLKLRSTVLILINGSSWKGKPVVGTADGIQKDSSVMLVIIHCTVYF